MLHANIDVGSYAWARQGFEFSSKADAVRDIRPRLLKEIDREQREVDQLTQELNGIPEGPEKYSLLERRKKIEGVLEKADALYEHFHVDSPHFPTPKEISELGRPIGLPSEEMRKLTWLGKNVLMERGKNISWAGFKRLDDD